MGWASLSKPTAPKSPSSSTNALEMWYKAVVMVRVQQREEVQVVQQKGVSIHILQDFGPDTFSDTKINVMLMAFLHTTDGSGLRLISHEDDTDDQQVQMINDISTASSSLNRPAWAPEVVLERINSDLSNRSFTERMADARQSGQSKLDKVPIHRLGVRTNSMAKKDELVGIGGICIKR